MLTFEGGRQNPHDIVTLEGGRQNPHDIVTFGTRSPKGAPNSKSELNSPFRKEN